MMRKLFFLLSIAAYINGHAQQTATIKEYKKIFDTYPFSDPDPIPDPTAKIYPYNHFDGYTNIPQKKEWKVIELENDYLRVLILPEIGGKVWAAIEKQTGKEFIYYNHVVKFRDVAMRGAWTSGGIESNFGIIGHTPNCSTPVDYVLQKKADGSVSCTVGALDLLTRTPWRIEINLPADKAYFTTKSFWFNASGLEQPYYHWMNAGIKASGNLEFIYPGTGFIGHEGETGDWPINKKNGKLVSWYKNNNFGAYKSYHVLGKYTNFFGGYWHDDDYGVVRYSNHDDKPGKKLWIWGLSQQGMIWEKLLTDKDGQYVEIQSGRLFNQSAEESAATPFKHRGFEPYAADTWTEYWYPVMHTKGYVFANEFGAINVKQDKDWLKIYFSPVQTINDQLSVTQNGKSIYNKNISLQPLKVFVDSIRLNDPSESITVSLGNGKLYWKTGDTTDNLSRPKSIAGNFDKNGMYGLYLQGKNNIYFRKYEEAEQKLRACLEKEPGYVPALCDLSSLLLRRMQYDSALMYAKKALSINTYDPAANYYYGLANKNLNNKTDAIDGFDIATQSDAYRGPAFTELAKMYFSVTDKSNDKSIHYAQKALLYNNQNMEALQLLAIAYRLSGNQTAAMEVLKKMDELDPINLFVQFEKGRWKGGSSNAKPVIVLQNEMPDQSWLELGLWYHGIGCDPECILALQSAPANNEINYWLAYLNRNTESENKYYNSAKEANRETAFPFRTESAIPLRWYVEHRKDWQPVFNLALIEASAGNQLTAIKLLNSCGQSPDISVFYANRAKLNGLFQAEQDLQTAIKMDPNQWRYYKQLTEWYNKYGNYGVALQTVKSYTDKNPDNYIMGMLLATTYLFNRQYKMAATVLDKIVVIPYEGATDGRRLYKEAHLMLAVEALQQKHANEAVKEIGMARQWPERLGVGKPYDEDIDERLEDYLLLQAHKQQSDKKKEVVALQKITANTAKLYKVNEAISAWAAGDSAALDSVQSLPATDENSRVLMAWLKNN